MVSDGLDPDQDDLLSVAASEESQLDLSLLYGLFALFECLIPSQLHWLNFIIKCIHFFFDEKL